MKSNGTKEKNLKTNVEQQINNKDINFYLKNFSENLSTLIKRIKV